MVFGIAFGMTSLSYIMFLKRLLSRATFRTRLFRKIKWCFTRELNFSCIFFNGVQISYGVVVRWYADLEKSFAFCALCLKALAYGN